MIDGAMDAGAGEMDERLLGQTLGGSYRVLRRIGAGGMGQVYEAEHTLLGRHFALKVLDTQQRTRRDAVSRFFAEARAASRIEHPHIVDVVNFVTDGPFMVLVMELLRGESLAERLLRGPLPLDETVTITSQVCDAVAATHAAGILHRDLKPANVFLCRSASGPFAKVLDYGIAKLRHPDGGGASDDDAGAEQAVGVTTTGQLLGTPRYLSPEQARGALELDERADVYSAGVMLFEMIAGRPPFDGQNAFQLLWKHGNEAPPRLSERAEGISPALDEVLARALAKEPDERYPSMLALRDALVAATAESSVSDVPPRPRTPVRRGALVVAGLALAVALLVTFGLRELPPTQADSGPRHGATLASASERASAAATLTASTRADSAPSVAYTPLGVEDTSGAGATRAADVTLRFAVQPAEARVAVDGGDSGPVPPSLRVSPGRSVQLLFTAPGFAPETRALNVSEDTDVVVSLRRRRGRATRDAAPSPIKRDF